MILYLYFDVFYVYVKNECDKMIISIININDILLFKNEKISFMLNLNFKFNLKIHYVIYDLLLYSIFKYQLIFKYQFFINFYYI